MCACCAHVLVRLEARIAQDAAQRAHVHGVGTVPARGAAEQRARLAQLAGVLRVERRHRGGAAAGAPAAEADHL